MRVAKRFFSLKLLFLCILLAFSAQAHALTIQLDVSNEILPVSGNYLTANVTVADMTATGTTASFNVDVDKKISQVLALLISESKLLYLIQH